MGCSDSKERVRQPGAVAVDSDVVAGSAVNSFHIEMHTPQRRMPRHVARPSPARTQEKVGASLAAVPLSSVPHYHLGKRSQDASTVSTKVLQADKTVPGVGRRVLLPASSPTTKRSLPLPEERRERHSRYEAEVETVNTLHRSTHSCPRHEQSYSGRSGTHRPPHLKGCLGEYWERAACLGAVLCDELPLSTRSTTSTSSTLPKNTLLGTDVTLPRGVPRKAVPMMREQGRHSSAGYRRSQSMSDAPSSETVIPKSSAKRGTGGRPSRTFSGLPSETPAAAPSLGSGAPLSKPSLLPRLTSSLKTATLSSPRQERHCDPSFRSVATMNEDSVGLVSRQPPRRSFSLSTPPREPLYVDRTSSATRDVVGTSDAIDLAGTPLPHALLTRSGSDDGVKGMAGTCLASEAISTVSSITFDRRHLAVCSGSPSSASLATEAVAAFSWRSPAQPELITPACMSCHAHLSSMMRSSSVGASPQDGSACHLPKDTAAASAGGRAAQVMPVPQRTNRVLELEDSNSLRCDEKQCPQEDRSVTSRAIRIPAAAQSPSNRTASLDLCWQRGSDEAERAASHPRKSNSELVREIRASTQQVKSILRTSKRLTETGPSPLPSSPLPPPPLPTAVEHHKRVFSRPLSFSFDVSSGGVSGSLTSHRGMEGAVWAHGDAVTPVPLTEGTTAAALHTDFILLRSTSGDAEGGRGFTSTPGAASSSTEFLIPIHNGVVSAAWLPPSIPNSRGNADPLIAIARVGGDDIASPLTAALAPLKNVDGPRCTTPFSNPNAAGTPRAPSIGVQDGEDKVATADTTTTTATTAAAAAALYHLHSNSQGSEGDKVAVTRWPSSVSPTSPALPIRSACTFEARCTSDEPPPEIMLATPPSPLLLSKRVRVVG